MYIVLCDVVVWLFCIILLYYVTLWGCLAGKLDIRLMGCQGLIEDIQGRTRKDNKSYPVLSPGESRTFPRTGSGKSYSLKQKEKSSKSFVSPRIAGAFVSLSCI